MNNIFPILEGPIVCETVYETECQTSYHLHEVEEDVPKCETIMVCIKLPIFWNRTRAYNK